MSDLFADDPRDTPPAPPEQKRSRALGITALVVVLGFFGLTTFSSIYTDRLWFRAGGYGDVFTTLFLTKTGLFLIFGALMALVVAGNMYLAYRTRPLFRPNSPEQTNLDRYRDAVTPIRTWLLVGVAVLLGLFAGSSAVGQWRQYLLWRNGVPFGSEDAYFNKDIGFYVFDLPWYHFLLDYAMAVTVVALLAAGVVHYLYGGVRLQATRDRLSGAAQAQLSFLLGIFVLIKAGDYWLDRFDLVNQTGRLITGMTYTDDHAVLPAKNILMGIAVICAVLFFVNVWRRTWMLPSVGLALLAVSAILLGLIWPGIVQQFQVKPSEADREAPYIKKNIEATRMAYDVDEVDVTPYGSNTSVSTGQLRELDGQTSSTPLVDPQLVRQTFEQNQQVRAYYSVAPVLDVDRYEIDGVDRALVLGVRELDQSGINAGDQNWSNLHTVYTHGNGIIAAYANQRPKSNTNESVDIQWAEGQEQGQDALGDYESRVYFGEQSPDYSVVGREDGSPAVELDLGRNTGGGSDVQDKTTTYDGLGGVDIGGFFNQLMYAVKFSEPNFLLSGRVNSNSTVLYNRTPRERVEKVAPWLTVDGDPYPAVVDGEILWVIDGYTTTDRYPSSERESFRTMTDDSLQDTVGLRALPTDEINYMRNTVKATVDAYDGTVRLYAWDETDPILQAWEGAFPGTVLDKELIPDGLIDHLRYPEDLFKVQRYQFARYHVTDEGDFYQGNNRWAVPEDPNVAGHLQPPYRLFVDEPESSGGDQNVFSLTSVFTPYNKNNLAAFVSVNSDASDPNYGKMSVLQLPDQQTPGPGLIANEFTSNSVIANELAQFNRSGGTTILGNLLTLPVKDGLIYVEPVYAVRAGSSSSYPILQYVLVSYGGEVGIGRTLGEALANVLGVDPDETPEPDPDEGNGDGKGDGKGEEPTGTVSEQIRAALAKADAAFAAADAALAKKDFATYGEEIEKAQRFVNQALALAAQQPEKASPKN